MKLEFDERFYKRLKKIKDKELLLKIKKAILNMEAAEKTQDILHLKKLEGAGNYYRIRIGDYRIGMELENEVFWLITIAHRNEIYKFFP